VARQRRGPGDAAVRRRPGRVLRRRALTPRLPHEIVARHARSSLLRLMLRERFASEL
jgi:hypothetical protein